MARWLEQGKRAFRATRAAQKQRDALFSIELIGDKELRRAFKALDVGLQRKALRRPFRENQDRTARRVADNLNNRLVRRIRGITWGAFADMPPKIQQSRRYLLIAGVALPPRLDLAIDSDDPYYYPMAIEYGHKRAPAHPFIRPAVDEFAAHEIQILSAEVGRNITREFRKHVGTRRVRGTV